MSGLFVSIEGPDGAGKSTIISLLKEKVSDAVFIRQPGGTDTGLAVRDILLGEGSRHRHTELLLFLASFKEVTEKIIKPALAEGKLVITDRWYFSAAAYQLYAHGESPDGMLSMVDIMGIAHPHLNLVISLSYDDWKARRDSRNTSSNLDNFESRDREFHRRVFNYYDQHCKGLLLDGMDAPEDIADNVLDHICMLHSEVDSWRR